MHSNVKIRTLITAIEYQTDTFFWMFTRLMSMLTICLSFSHHVTEMCPEFPLQIFQMWRRRSSFCHFFSVPNTRVTLLFNVQITRKCILKPLRASVLHQTVPVLHTYTVQHALSFNQPERSACTCAASTLARHLAKFSGNDFSSTVATRQVAPIDLGNKHPTQMS
jgi:hypothetical protein